jgi:hypothetical protein
MRKYSPTGAACPLFNRNEFLVARPDPDWVIHRHILYTCGVVITRPPLQNIIDPVSSEELQDTVLTLLRNNWASLLRNTDIFIGAGHHHCFDHVPCLVYVEMWFDYIKTALSRMGNRKPG